MDSRLCTGSPSGQRAGGPADGRKRRTAGCAGRRRRGRQSARRRCGIEILRKVRQRVDAAVAIQSVLGLVEPQSSGLGGGGFLLYYDAATKKITAFNGREAAPKGATPGMFLDDKGEPLSYRDAVISGRSTGVPGAIVMLGAAHARFGALPWAKLFDPAIRDAEDGVAVPKRMARFVNGDSPQASQPDVRALFSRPTAARCRPAIRSAILRMPRRSAGREPGPRALLQPRFATKSSRARTPNRAGHPGGLRTSTPTSRRYPNRVCGPYLAFLVCVPPPPSSGILAAAGARDPRPHRHRSARAGDRAGPGTCSRWRAA
jgi:gamma-glutamyltranspeptidase/glutathione hydrolase